MLARDVASCKNSWCAKTSSEGLSIAYLQIFYHMMVLIRMVVANLQLLERHVMRFSFDLELKM